MNFLCILCNQISSQKLAPFLCKECGALLEPARLDSEFQSLFRYNSALRSLILKVKIHGNYRALICLQYLFLNSPLSEEIAKASKILIPAPSSLWSRLHGRIDLAWSLGSALASRYNLPIQAAPLQLHWQLKKRSRTSDREKINAVSTSRNSENSTLLVDDVVTSGHTLRRLASALECENCCFLSLASALH